MAAQLRDDAWWAAHTTEEGPHAGKAWWGWGSVAELRMEVEAFLQAHPGERVLLPSTVAEAARLLPPPRIQLAALSAVVRRLCTTAPFERLLHSRGRDMVDIIRNARGDVRGAHDLVAYPACDGDVAALLRDCARLRLAAVPFGGGSSVVGGVEAPSEDLGYAGSVAVDMAKMCKVLEVDDASQCARVQGGIYGPQLEAELKRSNLTLRYYPQSFEYSTLGGWAATRGGGHFAMGPTHVDDIVQSLRVVSPSGATTGRQLPASGAGPAEHRLYLGSEGAFGIITEACVRLRRRPKARASATALFPAADADAAFLKGAAAVRAMAQTGLQPANLRLIYGPEVARMLGPGADAEARQGLGGVAVLVLGVEAPEEGPAAEAVLDSQLALLLQTAEDGGAARLSTTFAAKARDAGAAGERDGLAGFWGKGFMRGGYTLSTSCLFPSTLVNTFETACTWRAFPVLHAATLAATRAAIRRHCGVDGEVTCRFTHVYPDGPAPYYTVVVRGLPQDDRLPGQEDPRIGMWLAIKSAAMEAIIAAGGTSTHHHAVGRLHRPWYEAERGALCGPVLTAAKAVHDPDGIMNPGVLVCAPPRAKL